MKQKAFFGIIARAGAKAQITGNDGEVLDEMEIIQQVGFSSWIPEGSRVVIIPLLGKSSRSVRARQRLVKHQKINMNCL